MDMTFVEFANILAQNLFPITFNSLAAIILLRYFRGSALVVALAVCLIASAFYYLLFPFTFYLDTSGDRFIFGLYSAIGGGLQQGVIITLIGFLLFKKERVDRLRDSTKALGGFTLTLLAAASVMSVYTSILAFSEKSSFMYGASDELIYVLITYLFATIYSLVSLMLMTYVQWRVIPESKRPHSPKYMAWLMAIPVFNIFWLCSSLSRWAQTVKGALGDVNAREAQLADRIRYVFISLLCGWLFITLISVTVRYPDKATVMFMGLLSLILLGLSIAYLVYVIKLIRSLHTLEQKIRQTNTVESSIES
ncbi:hypothetical protein HCH_04015 [Hahella chejuensis KCTC 2396]|uniref:Uncharacterized protein n=1 Tax=Hahella chejuensis (strain KCTC 2396) TaxID=349521 RepID=Q2SF43_HAHCH|nr:hypothetical protein [Hahella chejuensis]ABC30731.1 hypothetical protein HCH_04015 [Hahella chejuensis KCTC 2396]